MTSNRDNDALSWGGDDDPTLTPGSVEPQLVEGWSIPHSTEQVENTHAAVTEPDAEEPRTSDAAAPDFAGSAALVFMGILAGVYLLYTIGWFIGAGRIVTPASTDPVATFMFSLGTWLAVAAPIVWFATSFWLTNDRPRLRLTWLLIGVVVLAPLPLLLGGNA
ncbi:hypothetical protein GY21_07215 [Cryobacterium roopkundense]|uniref:DNA polymerase III subunit gamma/tau n=1 Tax=Cryobacterium roopkundense TaxID=1001240 RepID=A0A099JHL4_9MICO|nr:hypothetical protein [Cryobacterium roopkundense]KGJ77560.1 hypothetical protein GY21_07215 [Cryobacterium roopkundense]MBB5641727.1 hypothetical protein [Cryobacterium roopkundense]